MAKREVTIVGFGDSITQAATQMPDDNMRWLKILDKKLTASFPNSTFNVINAGIGGNSTREAMARFEKEVLAHQPDFILLEFGGNNNDPTKPARRVPPEEFQELLNCFKAALPVATKVIVITFPPIIPEQHIYWKDPKFREYSAATEATMGIEVYRALTRVFAKQNNYPLYDLNEELVTLGKVHGQERYTLPDGVHLTAEGNRVLAEGVFASLKIMLESHP